MTIDLDDVLSNIYDPDHARETQRKITLRPDTAALEDIPNRWQDPFEIEIVTEEVTFLGKADQPDFATLTVTYVPSERLIELKAYKKFIQGLRHRLYSYERLTNEVFAALERHYRPKQLTVVLSCRARGGISTTVTRRSQP